MRSKSSCICSRSGIAMIVLSRTSGSNDLTRACPSGGRLASDIRTHLMNTAGPRRAAPNGHSIGRTSLPNSVAVAAIGSEIQHRDDVTAVERTRFSTLPVQTCASTTKRGGRAPGCEQHQRSAHRGSQRHADKPTEADRENTSIPTILHLRLLVDFQMASLSIFFADGTLAGPDRHRNFWSDSVSSNSMCAPRGCHLRGRRRG